MPAVPPVSRQQALSSIVEQFTLSKPLLESLIARFHELYDYGLSHDGAEMQMIPSFVTGVPTGSEKGTYLALDLGGTNLRVCEVALDGKGTFSIKQEKYRVSDALKQGPVRDLFDYMARSVDNFLTDFGALVNDTVGALLAHAYASKGALISAIFGTGTNGAYLESIDKIKKLKAAQGSISHMVVNTEWGGFDDQRKALPNHIFEKMISGMYLGEVARCVLLHLIDQLVLFQGYSSALMNRQYAFDTAYMSAVEADKEDASSPSSATRKVLVETMKIKPEYVSAEDVETSTGPEDDGVKVGMDGSVMSIIQTSRYACAVHYAELIGDEGEKRVKIGLAKDGSGVGAALGALQAAKQAASGHPTSDHEGARLYSSIEEARADGT
ncbi:putative glucokinase [Ustilago hordei]|uniref:putative glucokinase n=1 Tax=Ustilago hordei TaxID=120017 RepID=UPI001A4DE0C8|nr:putative glucokinase [Ustilago hordei]SYW83699.1 probable glucokinase [Ustilago hordei]